MIKKKVLALLLALVVLLSLCACGDRQVESEEPAEPTAEYFEAKLNTIGDKGYISAIMSLYMTLQEEGNAMGLSMTANFEHSGSVGHIGDAVISLMGDSFGFEIDTDTWLDEANGIMYENAVFMDEDSGWVKSSVYASELGASAFFDGIGRLLDGAEPILDSNSGDDWVLSWTALSANVADFLRNVAGGYADGVPMGDGNVAVTFDRASREPVSMTLTSTYLDDSNSGCSITFTTEFAGIGSDKTLDIPAEVVETAVENTGMNDSGVEISENGKLHIEGSGSDEKAYNLCDYLSNEDSGCEYVYLRYYDDATLVDWSTYGDNWYGSMAIDHTLDMSLYDIREAYADRAAQLDTEYGEARERSDNAALYVSADYNTASVRYICIDGDWYYEYAVAMLDTEATEADALSCLDYMKETVAAHMAG